ncbi:hypothetical protein Tco_0541440 [Tanacetum coccineum]
MEAFHVSLEEAKSKNIFEGVKVGSGKVDISNLRFADDALLIGLPIGANMNKACNWKPVIEKFHKRLFSWKAHTLSYGGRLTLVKLVLGALETYFFSLFKAPKCVLKYLEKLRRNFFWGGSIQSNKLAWVAWKKVFSPSTRGDLVLVVFKPQTLLC